MELKPSNYAVSLNTCVRSQAPSTSQTSGVLATEKDNAAPPSHATGRPCSDNRSAEEVIQANPSLDIFDKIDYPKGYKERLYKQVGDWTSNNPDPTSRADAAYNAARVFNYIESGKDSRTANSRPNSEATDGLRYAGYPPREASNAELMENFLQNGYSALIDPEAESQKAENTAIEAEKARIKDQQNASKADTTKRDETSRTENNIDYAPNGATGRLKGDRRTAEQIIKDNPILNNLPSSITKESLFKHLGDWTGSNPDPEKRADAAFNAARLFNYIDGLDVKESARNPSKQGDGKITGEHQAPLPPPFDDVTIVKGSEADLVKKFSEEGYAALGNHGTPLASDNEKRPQKIPPSPSGRPEGDKRTADQILNANPIIGRLEESLAEISGGARILEKLKALTGDWGENNTNAESRANAAYNIAKVANYLDANPTFYRLDEGFDNIGPGHLTDFTSEGANPNTEASALINFSNSGYTALAG